MTTAPSLFSVAPSTRPDESATERPAKSLVDLLYDGFYMLILLNNRSVPRDPDEFSGNIQKFLDQFERPAKKNNFNAEAIFDVNRSSNNANLTSGNCFSNAAFNKCTF